ncbi:MAG TPA: hypothetical protein VKA48_13050, partial [Gammaproteobacteria bacterium]|nr:hypothetical protein [Gammaproteobacteria bacterium]
MSDRKRIRGGRLTLLLAAGLLALTGCATGGGHHHGGHNGGGYHNNGHHDHNGYDYHGGMQGSRANR